LNEEATGYAQQKISVVCAECNFEINKERLAVARFVDDVALVHTSERDLAQHGLGVYLPWVLIIAI